MTYVWAKVEPGRLRRMTKVKAETNGYEFEDVGPPDALLVSKYDAAELKCSRERFSPEERGKLHLQTGEYFESYSDLKRYYKRTGTRSLEKGELLDRMQRDVKQWLADGGDKSGTPLPKYMTDRPFKSPIDIRKMLEETS